MGLIDLIFPKYCVNCKKYGNFLCPNCFSRLSFDTKNICLVCGNPSFNGLTHPRCVGKYTISGTFTGVVYNGVAKKLLYQFKYKPYLSSLGDFLTELLYESLIQNEEFDRSLKHVGKEVIFVPIPLSQAKLRSRGYNQSEILAKKLGDKLGFQVHNLLIRVKETKSQFKLTKKERKENIADAFGLQKEANNLITNKNLILIDDVLTTGSTLTEAAKILKKGSANNVWGIAFAREQ